MNKDKQIIDKMENIQGEVSELKKLLKKYVKEDKQKLRCGKCGSSFVYVRRTDKKLLCRKCGNIQDIEIEKENE